MRNSKAKRLRAIARATSSWSPELVQQYKGFTPLTMEHPERSYRRVYQQLKRRTA